MKKTKKIIICFIIALIVISIILIVLINAVKKDQSNIYESTIVKHYEEETAEEEEIELRVQNIVDNNIIYMVSGCIKNYYDTINNNSLEYYSIDDEGNYIKTYTDDMLRKAKINLLSQEYIDKNNITTNNVNNFAKSINEDVTIELLDVKGEKGERISKYYAYGIAINTNNEIADEFYMYVILDIQEETFAIEPIDNNNIENIQINTNIKEIIKNENNTYNIFSTNYQGIVKQQINRYKTLALAKAEIAYNYLDKEYREARFGSLENFESYVDNNKEEIAKIWAQSYLVNTYSDYTEYVIKDQFDNTYIFDEKSVLDYTIKLDTYTLDNDKFKKAYSTATNKDKVLMNLDKFFQMLNANDYKSSYAVLDEKYKATYFPTEESFENFVKQYMYPHANTKYMNYSDKISGVFTYYVELTNKENETDRVIGMNVVMQLQEGTNFKISFEIVR